MGPVTDLPFQWRFWVPVWVLAIALVCASLWLTWPVQAATPNGCELLGNTGNVIIFRCVDDSAGNVVYANSAGFMVVAQ